MFKLLVILFATKNSILDVVGVVDLPLNLLGEVFQRYLSVKIFISKAHRSASVTR